MKLSSVGNTNAVLFEPENKREEKWLNNYAVNNEYMKTKKAKTNVGVALGAIGASYISMFAGTFAKKSATKIASAILMFAGLATSITFAVKHFIDKKKFVEGPAEPQPQQETKQAEQTALDESTQA